MDRTMKLSPDEIQEIGQALFGDQWATPLAQALGIARQGIDHYMKEGVRGTQAAAILGVLARTILSARRAENERRADYDRAEAEMAALQARLEASATRVAGE